MKKFIRLSTNEKEKYIKNLKLYDVDKINFDSLGLTLPEGCTVNTSRSSQKTCRYKEVNFCVTGEIDEMQFKLLFSLSNQSSRKYPVKYYFEAFEELTTFVTPKNKIRLGFSIQTYDVNWEAAVKFKDFCKGFWTEEKEEKVMSLIDFFYKYKRLGSTSVLLCNLSLIMIKRPEFTLEEAVIALSLDAPQWDVVSRVDLHKAKAKILMDNVREMTREKVYQEYVTECKKIQDMLNKKYGTNFKFKQ